MHRLEHRQKIIIMVALMAGMLFSSLNQTIVGTALPRIISDLGGMEYFTWVFTIYMLASTVPVVIVGKLSDIYGRRPWILIGIGIFIVGSLLCGLAETIVQLIVFRGIQGMGGGIIMASSFAAVGDLFPPRQRGKWQSMLTGMYGVASVFGPALGGYIVDYMKWQWVFWVFIPIGFMAFALIWALFPKTEKKADQSIDYLGSAMLVAILIPLMLVFSWAGQKYDWLALETLALFSAALVFLVIFIAVEKRALQPALPLTLFRNNVFTISNIINFLMGTTMFGTIIYIPLFLQGVSGTTATVSGYFLIPITLSMVAGTFVGARLLSVAGKYKTLCLVSLFIICISQYLLSTMTAATAWQTITLYTSMVGIGFGITYSILTLTVQNSVDHHLLGVATGTGQLFRQLGGTIGVSVMGTVMNTRMIGALDTSMTNSGLLQTLFSSLPEQAQALLVSPNLLINPQQLQTIQNRLPETLLPVLIEWLELLRGGLGAGLSSVFQMSTIVMAVALCLAFALREIPLRTTMQIITEDHDQGKDVL